METKLQNTSVKKIWSRKLEEYIIRSKSLFDRDAKLSERFHSAWSETFQEFVDVEGIIFFQELYDVAPPFPFWTEMLTVGGETDIRTFLSVGYGCYRDVLSRIPVEKRKGNILDFGVGCGRTMRHFFRSINELNCYGCDVDSKSIKYLNEKIPFINATVSHNDPPLIYDEKFFDIVYCISVFTHFNELSFQNWMKEVSRILKKGGLFILTLHGKNAFNIVSNDLARRKMIGIKDEEFFAQKDRFQRDGFFWVSQPVGSNDIDSEKYGICFLNEDFLRHYLPADFEIQDYSSGSVGGWQDMVVLKKK
ncbi:MAG: class I SAM-dependent methyltransferase [Bacteroidia bacterium]